MGRRADATGAYVGLGLLISWFALVIAALAGWVTHVVTCIQTENWLFLIAGAVAAPVGAIHGWGIWFGWWG